jgi:hypothetical protein
VHRTEAAQLGVAIELIAFAPRRFVWDIRPGRRERAAATAHGSLEPATHARALVAVGLGVAHRKKNRRGLVLDSAPSLPLRAHTAVLRVDAAGAIDIGITRADETPPGDATELLKPGVAETVRGIGVPPLADLFAGCKAAGIRFFV